MSKLATTIVLKYNIYPKEETDSRLLYRTGDFVLAIWEKDNTTNISVVDHSNDRTLYLAATSDSNFDFTPAINLYLGCSYEDPDRHILHRARKPYRGEPTRIDVQDGANIFSIFASTVECATILMRLQKRFGASNVTLYAIGPIKAAFRSDGRIVDLMDQSVWPRFRRVDNYDSPSN